MFQYYYSNKSAMDDVDDGICSSSSYSEEDCPVCRRAVVMDASDISESEMETLRGDTIGDTMYSAKWTINVLISLSNVCETGWSDTLESELCLLWDMAAEKDVTIFLEKCDFLKIVEVSFNVSSEPRLTEILMGILGNMCCQSNVIQTVAERQELVSLLFNLLSTDDPETLIQLLRLLRVAVWDIQLQERRDVISPWLEHFKNYEVLGSSLVFILNSSTNDDLLIAAIDLIQAISTTDLSDEDLLESLIGVDELLPALIESFTQLIPKQDGNHTRSELRVIENWLTILDNLLEDNYLILGEEQYSNHFVGVLDILLRILQPYVKSHNLLPLDEISAVCIRDCVKLILSFQQHKLPVGPEFIFIIVTILFYLKSGNQSTDSETDSDKSENNERELSEYLEKYWFKILAMSDVEHLQDVLQMCEDSIVKYIMDTTISHPRTSTDTMEKLIIASESLN
ncbi:protein saal1 isoform X1 [Neodiprion lecontei]|uniref:Protein saal1 isoform X1 n=3 Tax=Neodiprion lecontei TaxID=441921 RepID=A0ABM3GEH7_NEOLC|nr:protein saal1 isoform X1 [Neodiprion lecontei]